VTVEVAADLAVDAVVADVAERALVPGAGGQEAQGDGGVGVVGEEDVAGQLLLDEAGVRFVGVGGADEGVAGRPGGGPRPGPGGGGASGRKAPRPPGAAPGARGGGGGPAAGRPPSGGRGRSRRLGGPRPLRGPASARSGRTSPAAATCACRRPATAA